jgi:hypothetical protein
MTTYTTSVLPQTNIHTLGSIQKIPDECYKRVQITTRRGEGVSFKNINIHSPELVELYENADFISNISKSIGLDLLVCPESDNHRVAIYRYNRDGDHVNWHYDKSFYEGDRVTVLIMVNDCDAEND